MEQFFLGLFLPRDELYIVDQKNVYIAVPVFKTHRLLVHDGVDEIVGEFLTGDIEHFGAGLLRQNEMSDGVHQMGLTQSHAAVYKQGIVGVGGGLCHRQRRRMGEPVAIAYDKCVEGVFRDQSGRCRFIAAVGRAVHLLRLVGKDEGYVDGPGGYLAQSLRNIGSVPGLEQTLHKIIGYREKKGILLHR